MISKINKTRWTFLSVTVVLSLTLMSLGSPFGQEIVGNAEAGIDPLIMTKVFDANGPVKQFATFNGQAYANAGNQVGRSSDGMTWEVAWDRGFGQLHAMCVYDNHLFVSADDGNGYVGNDNKIYRSADGSTFTQVFADDYGTDVRTFMFLEYQEDLYAFTYSYFAGGKVYKTSNGVDWSIICTSIHRGVNSRYSAVVYDNQMYAVLYEGYVVRSTDGTTWEEVYNSPPLIGLNTITSYKGELYVGTYSYGQVYKSSDGETWAKFWETGDNYEVFRAAIVWGDHLIFGTHGFAYGVRTYGSIWVYDGTNFEKVFYVDDADIISLLIFQNQVLAGTGYNDRIYCSQSLVIEATIDIDPDTLNLKSRGRWITCCITLPGGYDVNDIDVSTVLLEDVLPAEWGDIQGDVLMVKFDRSEVEDMLFPGTYNLKVTGLVSGSDFKGYSDEIRVIERP